MVGRTLTHYRINGQLGAGGMGVVYSAEDLRLGRQVALKFVSHDLAHDEQAILRLRSEARAASALNHPNICTIYDIGDDDGRPFIVMELIKGQTLRERLNAGPLAFAALAQIGAEIADALQAAHTQGIIHRDIKPGNIFVTDRGNAKVLDFGLAKLTSTLTTNTTTERIHTSAAGETRGTVAYMSPEQASGEQLDGRTDVFSLGVVLYECATGQHPFPGKTSAVILASILDRAPAPPMMWRTDLPLRLNEIIHNCLEKDRELRYQSAADLRADLRRLRRDLDSTHSRPVDMLAFESGAATDLTPPSGSRAVTSAASSGRQTGSGTAPSATAVRPAPRRPWLAAAGALAIVGVLAVAGLMMWRPPPDTSSSAGPADAPAASPAAVPAGATDAAAAAAEQMRLATVAFDAGSYERARALALNILAQDPAHAGALAMRDNAGAMLERFDAAIDQARTRLAAGDVAGAARALDAARTIDPSAATVIDLRSRLAEAVRQQETRAAAAGRRDAPPAATRDAAGPAAGQAAAPRQTPGPPQPEPRAETRPADPNPIAAPATAPPVPASPATSAPVPIPPPVTPTPPRTEPAAQEAPASRPESPAPSPPPAETDEAAIRRVLATYERAIEQKDLALFRTVKPNLSRQEERRLDDGFRAVTSQRVDLSIVSIDRKGDRAGVVVTRRDVVEAGGRQQTIDSQQLITFARTAAGWVITEIR